MSAPVAAPSNATAPVAAPVAAPNADVTIILNIFNLIVFLIVMTYFSIGYNADFSKIYATAKSKRRSWFEQFSDNWWTRFFIVQIPMALNYACQGVIAWSFLLILSSRWTGIYSDIATSSLLSSVVVVGVIFVIAKHAVHISADRAQFFKTKAGFWRWLTLALDLGCSVILIAMFSVLLNYADGHVATLGVSVPVVAMRVGVAFSVICAAFELLVGVSYVVSQWNSKTDSSKSS